MKDAYDLVIIRIPGTPYQLGLLQIRHYVPRIPPVLTEQALAL